MKFVREQMCAIMLLQIRNRHVKDDKKQQVHVTMYLTAQEEHLFFTFRMTG